MKASLGILWCDRNQSNGSSSFNFLTLNILKQKVVSSNNCRLWLVWGRRALHAKLQVSIKCWACTSSWLLIWLFFIQQMSPDTFSDSHNKLFCWFITKEEVENKAGYHEAERSVFPLVWLGENITGPCFTLITSAVSKYSTLKSSEDHFNIVLFI